MMPDRDAPRRTRVRRGPRKSAKTKSFSAELPELHDWMAALRDGIEEAGAVLGDVAAPVAGTDGLESNCTREAAAESQEPSEVGGAGETDNVASSIVPLLAEQQALLASLERSVASIDMTVSEVVDRLPPPSPPVPVATADDLTTAELLAALKGRARSWGHHIALKVAATKGR